MDKTPLYSLKSLVFLFFSAVCAINSHSAQTSHLKQGERFITVNGVKHWTKTQGARNKTAPLIILHGGPCGDNYNFERTTGPLLEKRLLVVYYEQRGCGRSGAAEDANAYSIPILVDDLHKIITALKLKKANLLGYSFGAELALRFAKQYPKQVDKLILESPVEISTQTKLIQIQGFYSVASNSFRADIEAVLNKDFTLDRKHLLIWESAPISIVDKFLFVDQGVAKVNRKLWQEAKLPSPGRKHFIKRILENSKGDLLEISKELTAKTLIISGIHDKNGGFHYGKDLHKILPNSSLVLYYKSAHFPDMEEPNKFSSDVMNHIF